MDCKICWLGMRRTCLTQTKVDFKSNLNCLDQDPMSDLIIPPKLSFKLTFEIDGVAELRFGTWSYIKTPYWNISMNQAGPLACTAFSKGRSTS